MLARSGALEARLAITRKDVRRAQKLRYRAFFEESGAIPDPTARIIRRDVCPFDAVSDHLIVVDRTLHHRDGSPRFVGVYRLLRQDVAERNFGFYSALEFDVDSLIARRPLTRFLEVGRACIAPTHRGRRVLELLWRGLWAYARHHNIDAMIGCASLPGADPALHAGAIRALAAGGGDPSWQVAPWRALRRPVRLWLLRAAGRPARADPRPAAARQRLLAPRRDLQPCPGCRPRLQHHRHLRRDAAVRHRTALSAIFRRRAGAGAARGLKRRAGNSHPRRIRLWERSRRS